MWYQVQGARWRWAMRHRATLHWIPLLCTHQQRTWKLTLTVDALPFHVLVWKVRCCGALCLENRLELCYCGNFLRDKWHKGALAEYSISCCGFAFSDIQESITINNYSWCQTVSSRTPLYPADENSRANSLRSLRYDPPEPARGGLLNPQVHLQLIWQIFSCPESPESWHSPKLMQTLCQADLTPLSPR